MGGGGGGGREGELSTNDLPNTHVSVKNASYLIVALGDPFPLPNTLNNVFHVYLGQPAT